MKFNKYAQPAHAGDGSTGGEKTAGFASLAAPAQKRAIIEALLAPDLLSAPDAQAVGPV